MPEKVDALASAAGAFNLFVSVVVSCGFICCAAYSLAHHDLYGVFGWLSQALCCWGVFYGGYLTSTYRTLHHFVTLARIQVAQTILTFGMVFLLPFLRFYGLCARVAFPSFLAVWLYHRNRPLKVSYRFDTKALRELIKIGLPFSFWGNLYTSVWTATESALVLSLGGVSALGLFSVAAVMRECDELPAYGDMAGPDSTRCHRLCAGWKRAQRQRTDHVGDCRAHGIHDTTRLCRFIFVGYIRSIFHPKICCRYSGNEGMPLVSGCPGSIFADQYPFCHRQAVALWP